MNPGDLIGYIFVGFCLLLLIVLMIIVFKKQKKAIFSLAAVLLVLYIGYYFLFPSIQSYKHEQSYAILTTYLAENFPNQQFTIEPVEYEAGVTPGDFYINDVRTPSYGVMMRVKGEHEVAQLGTWQAPIEEQQNIWQSLLLYYNEAYHLNEPIDRIERLAYYENGQQTIFGLKVDDHLTIAQFDYFSGGYSLQHIEDFPMKPFVHLVVNEQLIVFVTAENSEQKITVPLQSGEEHIIEVKPFHAQLIVENL